MWRTFSLNKVNVSNTHIPDSLWNACLKNSKSRRSIKYRFQNYVAWQVVDYFTQPQKKTPNPNNAVKVSWGLWQNYNQLEAHEVLMWTGCFFRKSKQLAMKTIFNKRKIHYQNEPLKGWYQPYVLAHGNLGYFGFVLLIQKILSSC